MLFTNLANSFSISHSETEMPDRVGHDGWQVGHDGLQVGHDAISEMPDQVGHDGWQVGHDG